MTLKLKKEKEKKAKKNNCVTTAKLILWTY